MDIRELSEIFYLISSGTKDVSSRKDECELRKKALSSLNGIVKVAFDTRRINQETDYIPRRGLQNYHRSEPFVTEAMHDKLSIFAKLKAILDNLKAVFETYPEWQDSYVRVLLNSIERALRTHQKDGDYTESQPGVGSLDYLEELLYVRYRLTPDMVKSMSDANLAKLLLQKDDSLGQLGLSLRKSPEPVEIATTATIFPNLVSNAVPVRAPVEIPYASVYANNNISRGDVITKNYDTLLDKLFGDVKASADNKEVERTITITVKDKVVG